jgi:hypothetical protein
MALPTFRSLAARRQGKEQEKEAQRANGENISDRTLTPEYTPGVDIRRATKTRKSWILLTCFFYLFSVVFLILVCFRVFSIFQIP